MSGIVSGIAKVFKPIVSVAARIIKPVAAIGAALFTGGGALGAGGTLGSLLSVGGTLASTLSTAFGKAGFDAGAGLATGAGFGAAPPGFLNALGTVGGGLSEASSSYGGDMGAMSTQGQYAQGVGDTTAANIATPTRGLFGGVQGGSLLAGLGSGLSAWLQARQEERMLDKTLGSREKIAKRELDYLREKQQKITDSYNVDDRVHEQPAQRVRYQYDPSSGQVVPV